MSGLKTLSPSAGTSGRCAYTETRCHDGRQVDRCGQPADKTELCMKDTAPSALRALGFLEVGGRFVHPGPVSWEGEFRTAVMAAGFTFDEDTADGGVIVRPRGRK
jgi:hypothetical protein